MIKPVGILRIGISDAPVVESGIKGFDFVHDVIASGFIAILIILVAGKGGVMLLLFSMLDGEVF